jgi:hypothetical protein
VELVQQISSHPSVERVIALGTLFALELRAEGHNVGYGHIQLLLCHFLDMNDFHSYPTAVVQGIKMYIFVQLVLRLGLNVSN